MTKIETKPFALAIAASNGLPRLAVTIREAATMLSISPRSVQNYIREKKLPARKIGRRTVILVSALEIFLRRDHESPAVGSAKSEAQ